MASASSQKVPQSWKPKRGSGSGSGSGSRSRSGGLKDIHIDEVVKIAVNLSLERFRYSDDKELEFPPSLTNTERAFIHRTAQSLGYISKSKGKGPKRFLTVRKKDGSNNLGRKSLSVSHNSLYLMRSLLQRSPISNKTCARQAAGSSVSPESDVSDRNKAGWRLNNGIPLVPRRRNPSELDAFRCALPVYERQEEILALIRKNRVVLVLGETGSGKTTQIPQFVLDECSRMKEPCRIFCTQPRRLAAIAVAERVAAERGESVGQTVGFHIRLERRVSPKTGLTFCTSGVLLRTLMAGDASLTTVTHVIVDEVHERDGLTDFLLIKMRDILEKIPTLKLILSSAALDIDLFRNYFGHCPVIKLKGRQFEVKELFLEEVLRLTGFNPDIKLHTEDMQRKVQQQKQLTEWCRAAESRSAVDEQSSSPSGAQDTLVDQAGAANHTVGGEQVGLWLQKEIDTCISKIFLHEEEEAFTQLFNLILYEGVSVDCRHSETGSTPLMVAAARGFISQMDQLLSSGADINLSVSNGWTALDFAEHFQQTDAVDLLKSSIPLAGPGERELPVVQAGEATELTSEEQALLKLYHAGFDDQRVDLDLIMELLAYICSTTATDGAVLIFLPGYDEILSLRDRILFDDKRFCLHPDRYQVFTLHSDIKTSDQKKAMKPCPPGVRKIILSTNIAETSITINDVVFVIDSGKVKEKSFDTISRVSMLKTVWISKASALQRKGRAGRCRPGICFHLFSRLRFHSMLEFQVPQLLRMPLQDLCLQTKLLAPSSCPVAEFLSKAPQPPPAHAIRNAVDMLKTIDAMDPNEDLTDLGFHLADLPVEPHLGKMVLCAVILKCLDPVLTIACMLAYRDPFILPPASSQKRAALHCRKRFSANTFSDHMALLRAFQAWQKARKDGWERSFCEKNFLSQATMDMILGMRAQLLGQLRAIGFVRARGGNDIRNVNQNSENWAVVKAALVAGMYPNLVHMKEDKALASSSRESKIHFHPTSILSHNMESESGRSSSRNLPTDWLIYDEMNRSHRNASVRCCSLVTAITVAIFAGCSRFPDSFLEEPAAHTDMGQKSTNADGGDSDSDTEELAEIKIDDWLVFHLETEAAKLLFAFRQKWHNLFMRRIRCPSKPWTQQDEEVIRTLVSVLAGEEQGAGLQQPTGIGQRPWPISSEEGPQAVVTNTETSPHLPARSTPDRPSRTPPASGRHLESHSRKETALSDYVAASVTLESQSDSHATTSSGQGFSSVRYFIMKSSNMRNIEISQQRGIWSTTPANESRLSRAFTLDTVVILIFSVQGSGHFQGYARMMSNVSGEGCQDWGLDSLGGVFGVDWIHKESIPFHCSQHILNGWNENKKVQISRDGQELEPQAGRELLLLWERNSALQ